MKKGILIGCIVLALTALAWFGGKKIFGPKEADVTSESAELSEQDGVSSNDADAAETEETADSGMIAPEAETESPAAEAEVAAKEDDSGETTAESDIADTQGETAVSSEAGTLYTIKTSAGNNLGMVPIVNGNAVVLMDGGSGTIYQGEYTTAEQNAGRMKAEEQASLAASEGKIGEWAFYREASMNDFVFPEGVTAIEKFAFARSGLKGVAIPEGVTSIGYGAFYHCDQLLDVTIPDSVTVIEENAFAHTPWLENWMAGGEAGTEDEAAGAADADDFLIVGDGILIAYRGSETELELPPEVKTIAAGVFDGNQ